MPLDLNNFLHHFFHWMTSSGIPLFCALEIDPRRSDQKGIKSALTSTLPSKILEYFRCTSQSAKCNRIPPKTSGPWPLVPPSFLRIFSRRQNGMHTSCLFLVCIARGWQKYLIPVSLIKMFQISLKECACDSYKLLTCPSTYSLPPNLLC